MTNLNGSVTVQVLGYQAQSLPFSLIPNGGNGVRPPNNTGAGFYVSGGQLYDPKNFGFRIRGVNRNHYDSPGSAAGITKAHANTTRIFVTSQYGDTPAQLESICQTQHVANKQLVIPVCSSAPNGSGGYTGMSGSTDPAVLQDAVNWWIGAEATWASLNDTMVLNIANEWGPKNSPVWRDSNIAAIAALRKAGILAPILVDAGGYGQDDADILTYAPAVFAADPQSNTFFSVHLYGTCNAYNDTVKSISGNIVTLASTATAHPFCPGYNPAQPSTSWNGITAYSIGSVAYPSSQNVGGTGPGAWTIKLNAAPPASIVDQTVLDYNGNYALRIQRLAAMAAQGICVIIGEFGPGQNIGPSPTLVSPQQIIAACESAGIGWMPWAWDDNNLPGGLTSPTGWFGMTLTGPGNYTQVSDLTAYGQLMIPFWQQLASYPNE